jgi:hypothetical protein
MTQEKATKRPWCVAVETEAEDGLTITIPVEEWEPDLANADLIVAAVNERDQLLSEVAALRRALEMIVCHGCKNRIGWNETPTKYGDWTKCSSCKQARALLGKER